MPPPASAKKKREEHQQQIELGKFDDPEPRPTTLSKVARMGLPPLPARDYDLPDPSTLAGDFRSRVDILCKSILQPEFVAHLNATNFFTVLGHYRAGTDNEHLHLGEIFQADIGPRSFGSSSANAWVVFQAGVVTQFFHCNHNAMFEGIPNFLFTLENYLMYIHIRVGKPLPPEIFKK